MWQPPPSWVIEAGALSISNATFNSLSASSGQCTFQIQVPSTSVYLDRLLNWQSDVNVQFDVAFNFAPPGAAPAAGPAGRVYAQPIPIFVPGQDFSLCPSPLHSLVTSLQAAIGDTQVTNNLAQTRELLSVLADSPGNRKERTQPAFLDLYRSYYDSQGAVNDPLAAFNGATTGATEGNGSWPVYFLAPAGVSGLTQPVENGPPVTWYIDNNGTVTSTVPVGSATVLGWDVIQLSYGGVPSIVSSQFTTWTPGTGGAPGTSAPAAVTTFQAPKYQMYLTFNSIEPLQLSPFIYQEVHERQTGLAQLQNINIIANMQSPAQARLIRWRPNGVSGQPRYCANFSYYTPAGSTSPFQNARILAQFLTPPIELMPLPEINTVDFQQVTSYPYPVTISSGPVRSQTLSLPIIPDYLVVALVPQPQYYQSLSYGAASYDGTFYVPIKRVNVTWSNMSGLLSSQTQTQLFNMSKANGLDMTWAQWRGYAFSSATTTPAIPAFAPTLPGFPSFPSIAQDAPGLVALSGGPLVLRPGKDITLETGSASGMSAGQWTVLFEVTPDVSNMSDAQLQALSAQNSCNLVVLAINGGFFATKAGSSRVIIGPVPAGTVVKAPLDKAAEPEPSGERMVGGGKRARHALSGRV